VRENWVVPPGLRSFFPLFPALKRWAKLVRPSGTAFSSSSFHRIAKTSVLTHTLKRWAKLARPSGAGSSDISFRWIARKRGFTETLNRRSHPKAITRSSFSGLCEAVDESKLSQRQTAAATQKQRESEFFSTLYYPGTHAAGAKNATMGLAVVAP